MPGSRGSPEIIALGEPMAEFAAEQRGRLGEVRTFRRGFGGDTANFIVAVARMGTSSGYVARVGGDEFGSAFLALWRREGVDHSRVIVEADGITGVYFISTRDREGHDFTYYRTASAASRLSPGDLDEAYIAGAKVFHTSGITQATSETAREAVDTALGIVEQAGHTISYDANVRPRLWPLEAARSVVERTFARAQLVFVSEEDAAHLYPGVDPEIVVQHIMGFGPRTVVLKRGAKGCLVATPERGRVAMAAWPVDVVDTTGAGDAFAGAFVASWLEGADVEEAARVANTAGALTAMGLGAVQPIPTRAQIMEFIREHRTETDHPAK